MKRIYPLLILLLFAELLYSQPLTGTKTIPGDYATIQEAIVALNSHGVGYGGVTFNVAAGSSETLASATSGLINYYCGPSWYSNTYSPVVFQKSGSGANPLITAFTPGTSTATDGIIMLAGVNSITFDGIDLQENPLNITPTMQMEWGYALVKKNTTAPVMGCQNVTIRNCNITLNKANTASCGIHAGNHVFNSSTVLNFSISSDANNGCRFYGNNISNVSNGIDVEGYSGSLALYDNANEIGVTAGNVITNFGGGAGNPCGIYASYQENLKIAGNTVNGGSGSSGNLYGIYTGPGTGSDLEISGNTVTLTPTVAINTFFGIRNTMGSISSSPNTVSIFNNIIENFTSPVSSNWPSCLISQEASAATVNIYGNILRNNTSYGANYFYAIAELSNVAGGIRNIYNNQIFNLSIGTSTSVYGIDYNTSTTTTGNIYNNTIHGIVSNGGTNKGIMLEAGGTTNLYRNKLYDISSNGNGTNGQGLITGVHIQATTTVNLFNNYISDLRGPTTMYGYAGDAIDGIFLNTATTCNITGNTIYLNASSIYSGFRTSCLSISSNVISSVVLKNNILVNLSASTGTGNFATAMRRGSTSLTNYATTSDNNLFYAGTPGPNHLIFEDYTNADQTLAAFRARVTPRETSSITELPPFINAAGNDLHLTAGAGTACESGGQVIASPIAITDDFDGDARYPNAGYPNNPAHPATAPDIGADEFAGSADNTPPVISYTSVPDPPDNNPVTLTATIIDQGLGVATSGGGLPMLYWKKSSDAGYTGVQGVSAGAGQYTFIFGSGVSSGDVVYYYVVAQDLVVPANVSAYPSSGAAGYSSNPPAVSTPPSAPNYYTVQSPLVGTKTIPGDFASIQAAVAVLNSRGTGTTGITFNVAAGYTETFTNAGGGLINFTCSPSWYSSATNPVVFRKWGAGANPLITAFTPGTSLTLDGIIKIAGGDYITFDGIDLQENPLNTTPTMQMEWGYALVKKNASGSADGCQNVVIRNCSITLNKTNTATSGIHIGDHTTGSVNPINVVTAATDAHNNCKIYSNTISNSYTGIDLQGYSGGISAYDGGNEIGVSGGNTIANFGGGSIAAQAIYTSYQQNLKVVNNIVSGGAGTTGYLYGINLASGTGSSADVTGNDITLGAATSHIYGIYNAMGNAGAAPNTLNISNNIIENCSGTLAGDSYLYGIYQYATASTVNLNGNIIRNFTKPSTGQICAIFQNNTAASGAENISNSQIYNLTSTGATSVVGIESYPASTTTGTLSGNLIHALSSAGGTNIAIEAKSMAFAHISGNRIYTIGSTGSGSVTGINLYSVINTNAYNNYISDLQLPAGANTGFSMAGIASNYGTTLTLFNNTIYLNSNTPAVTYSVAALSLLSNSTALTMNNNIFINLYQSTGTYRSSVFYRYGTDLANYNTGSGNNLFYCGIPGANNVVFYNNTTWYQTLATFQSAVSPREANSVTELPPFTDAANNNLHLLAGLETLCESGGKIITAPDSIAHDQDGDARYPNAGYPFIALDMPTAPDIGADEFAGGHVRTPPVIAYTPLGNPVTVAAQTLTATITDPTSSIPTSGTGLPVLYWKKNSTAAWTAAQGISAGNNLYSFTFGSGVISGDVIYYYIAAQGTWPIPNVGASPSNLAGGYTANPPAASVPPTNPSSYTVQSPVSGTVTVGASGTYQNITGAGGLFQNINTVGLQGNLVAVILNDLTEPGTYQLNQWSETGAGNYTLAIVPDATTQRVISGTAVAAATPMIGINGADRVTINGGSGKYLLFRNTLASANFTGPSIQFSNGSVNDTLKNCIIESNESTATSGTVTLGSTGTNSVYIASCDIRNPTGGNAGNASNAINAGNAGNANNVVNLQLNNIYNFTNAAVYMAGVANGCTVNGNNLYETSVQTSSLYGIYIGGGSGHTITSNNFGGSNATRTGAAVTTSAGITGIYLSVGTSSPTSVQGNHLSNFGSTGSSAIAAVYGIQVAGGNVNLGTVTGNVFGGGALASDTIRSGYDNGIIYCFGSGVVNIENNTVGNIAHWVGGNDRTAGMLITGGMVHVKNNIIRDIRSNANGNGYIYLPVGIEVNSVTNAVIEGNTITNIWDFNTGASAFMAAGIVVQSPSVSGIVIRNNKISNIYATGTGTGSSSPQLYGIYNYGTTSSVYNNMILLGQSPATAECRITGIYDLSSSASTYYFNSVSITGTASGTNSSYAFYTGATGTLTVKDNIFYNGRSGGSVKPYAIGTGAAATPVSNYNDLFSTGSYLGLWNATNCATLAAWRTASSQDAASVSGDPYFMSSTDLHINTTTASPVKNAGLNIPSVSTDYDSETRNNPPDIGADEYTSSPVIVTAPATQVTWNSATLNGTVNANNETTTVSFEYGTTVSYGSTATVTPATVSGSSTTPVSAALALLAPNTLYHFRVTGVAGNIAFHGSDLTFTTLSDTKTIQLTSLFLEGLYAGNGAMNQAYDENGPHWATGIADHITVELHSSTPGYYSTLVYRATDVALTTTGTAAFTIPATFNGTYYIAVKHRNSLETVSAMPVSFSGGVITQSFGTPADVYGGNLLQMADMGYAIYGGDVSQDGAVDLSDFAPVDNQAAEFATGYLPEDVNGDGGVDLTDFAIIDNNAAAFIGAVTPP